MNSISITEFFHIICIAIIDYFIISGRENGVLRLISHYYSIRKTNSGSMLYLHCIP